MTISNVEDKKEVIIVNNPNKKIIKNAPITIIISEDDIEAKIFFNKSDLASEIMNKIKKFVKEIEIKSINKNRERSYEIKGSGITVKMKEFFLLENWKIIN